MPIKDQYQFRKAEAELRGFEALRILRPLFLLGGAKGREAARLLAEDIPKLRAKLDRLRNWADDFNALFQPHGWIAHDDMNLTAAQEAIRLAGATGLEAAEQFLEDHYNGDPIDNWLRWYSNMPEFRLRREILMLAWEDHKAGRYHASVPVVLAQIDGIAHDMANKTFYKQRADDVTHLTAKETVAGDPSGIAALARLLSVRRDTTDPGPISIPYRHGILHGRDLGYANRRTSTKAFAILLALRPWVLKIRTGEQFVEPPIDYFDPDSATWEDVKAEWQKAVQAIREYSDVLQQRQ